MGDGHCCEFPGRWILRRECDEMTLFWKTAAPVTCVAAICGASILWPGYKAKLMERKLVEAARVRAEQGDANAEFSLGNMYARGQVATRDDGEAFRWYRKAAEQGLTKAQYALGYLYHQGRGVPRDDAEAARWYRKAADQGYAKAQYGLAFMYGYGQGVPQDYAEAVRWCRKAADQGDASAQYALGLRYLDGMGVSRDDAEAVRWIRKSADQGYPVAQSDLGFMYYRGQGVPQDYAEAVRWFRKAGYQGDRTAQGILFLIYFRGQGVPKDYIEAIRWLGKIAASCFGREGPLQRWTSFLVILLALPILVVSKRRWGRATWLPSALCSALLAAALAHERFLSETSLAALGQVLPGAMMKGAGRVLWLALLASGSALFAIGAMVEVVRASKRGDRGQPPTLESPT